MSKCRCLNDWKQPVANANIFRTYKVCMKCGQYWLRHPGVENHIRMTVSAVRVDLTPRELSPIWEMIRKAEASKV
jgi:hypothetical protein